MPSDKRQRQRQNAAARAAAARASQQRRANRRRALIGGLAVAAIVAIIALFVVQSTGNSTKKTAATTTTSAAATGAPPIAPPVPAGASITGPTPCPKFDGSSPRTTHFAQAPPSCIDPTKSYTATFATSEGNVVVALDTKNVAGTVNNFVVLSLYHYYDKSSFDRIDQSIEIIQGGSPSTQTAADPGPGYTINDEGHFTTDATGNLHGPYTYKAGDLVMARGSGPKSAAAQYFFVTGAKASVLDAQGTYVTFGHVTQGLDILQNIESKLYQACPASATTCGPGGAPSKVVLVKTITITQS